MQKLFLLVQYFFWMNSIILLSKKQLKRKRLAPKLCLTLKSRIAAIKVNKAGKNKKKLIKIKIGINPLLDDLKRLMNEEETKDFQIISNNQKIKIHKIILIARSELFRGMFISVTEDKSNSVHEYSNKKTKTIQNLVNFFYTDEIPKIKNKTILKELKECVDYFQLNSKRLNQLIKKIIGEIPQQQQQQQQNSKKKCLIF
ncbi:hypothetical protein M0811_08955 [Anaeramoeba ignava]|uniref:BTB domain-containing protein n=1 Tax=Anaeramoeba ignava TaxID=1746090 RepID=A0A9Q0RB85_ANAIG|nr:hypothetical protein M0811_08955 [Anaeramoeba ignava]